MEGIIGNKMTWRENEFTSSECDVRVVEGSNCRESTVHKMFLVKLRGVCQMKFIRES